jgi:dipeptidyl-peptidase-4
MVRRFLAISIAVLCFASTCCAARAAADLSFDEIFAATAPWGAQPSRITWSPDGRSFLYVLPSQDAEQAVAIRQYDVAAGQSRVLIDPAQYGGKPETPSHVSWSADGKRVAFVVRGTLYVRDIATNLDRVVAKDVGDALWSPAATVIAFTHGADLYFATLEPKLHVRRLTAGGRVDELLNGDLDWVYPEELGTQHGFAWSSDGSQIAYMRMDERAVTAFPIVDFLPYDNKIVYQRYPLAGEPNPHVSLHVVDVKNLDDRLIYDAGEHDEYLPSFTWKPNSHTLLAELIDRGQQHLRVVAWSGGDAPSTLIEQSDSKWVDVIAPPLWLPDGSALWVLARDNVAGLYMRSARGALSRLSGSFRVFELLSVDPKSRTAYVTAAYPTRRDRALLAISLSGGPPVNLTPSAGAHTVALSPTNADFVDTHSTLNDPPQTDLVHTSSGTVRATLAARNESLRSQLLPAQMLRVPSSYGDLDAYMIRPPDFDAHRKYPVVIYVYGGPAAPTTANVFGLVRGLYHQMLARAGFIVFSIDGPASQIDNEEHVRLLYHNFGPGSLLGQRIGAEYLRSLPYVDSSRIGIWGWSFGGYETVYALTHSDLFKAGAAGAPVTDWHLYDSIYTERYMGLPRENRAAYDTSSVLNAAQTLHGDLLISHGTSDDNVHMANTISLLQMFVTSGKSHVDFMAYPRQHHGFTALPDLREVYEYMLGWWVKHL